MPTWKRVSAMLLCVVMLLSMMPTVYAEVPTAELSAANTRILENAVDVLPTELTADIFEDETVIETEVSETAPTLDASTVASGSCGDNLTWVLDENYTLTISGTGEMYDYDTSDPPWYSYRYDIVSVVLNSGVTNIGGGTFMDYDSITSISIPDSVTSIGLWAFWSCDSITDIVIPDSVTSIGEYAFAECDSLTNVDLSANLTSIDEGVFYYCINITNINIPASVTSIGKDAFSFCDRLRGIWVDSDNPYFCNDEQGILYNKEMTTLLIAPGAIEDCFIPDSVTRIGDYAFANCNSLSEVHIPASVTEIRDCAFYCCRSLFGIWVNADNAYYCSDKQGILYSKDMTALLSVPGVIDNCVIPASVTNIGDYAFAYCVSLTKIQIPDSVTSIGEWAFAVCESLTEINIPEGITSIEDATFLCCKSLTSVNLPDSVTSIGVNAFTSCSDLTEITIPKRVTSIDGSAFGGCGYLEIVTFTGDAPKIDTDSFSDVTATCYYPANYSGWTSDVRQDYGGTLTWVGYEKKIDAPVVKASNVASSGKIKLKWDPVDDAEAYKVYRSTREDGYYSLMETVEDTTSYTNTSASIGKTYYYYVIAVASDGSTSDQSNIVSRTCNCARPEIKLSSVASSGKIKISWDKVDGAAEYKVYRSTSKNGDYSLMKTVTGTSMVNNSAKAGKTYYYKVKAIPENGTGSSAYSKVKSRMCDLPRPDVSVTLNSSGKPKLTWDKVDGAVEYKVYRATSKNGEYSLMKTVNGTKFTNTSAKAYKVYYYKVMAVHNKSNANSAYSSKVFISATSVNISDSKINKDVVTKINEYRTKQGLPKLKWLTDSQMAARIRAAELKKSFSINRPDGTSMNSMYKAYRMEAECYGKGFSNASKFVKALMDSTYASTCLSEEYTYAVAARNGNYWTVMFG